MGQKVQNEPEINENEDVEKGTKREIVIPGEVLSDDPSFQPGRGVLKEGNTITALYIGLKNIRGKYVNVVPLRGLYTPVVGDTIIGKIADKTAVKWFVDINSKKDGILKPSDLSGDRYEKRNYNRGRGGGGGRDRNSMNTLKLGDMIKCKIMSASRISSPDLTTYGEGLGKLNDGLCIQIDVPKIPRVIGKRGSMIKLLKDLTSCRVFVSKNGRIWLKGKNEDYEKLAIDVIHKIEREAHTSGLTDRINYYIKEQKKLRGLN